MCLARRKIKSKVNNSLVACYFSSNPNQVNWCEKFYSFQLNTQIKRNHEIQNRFCYSNAITIRVITRQSGKIDNLCAFQLKHTGLGINVLIRSIIQCALCTKGNDTCVLMRVPVTPTTREYAKPKPVKYGVDVGRQCLAIVNRNQHILITHLLANSFLHEYSVSLAGDG